MTDPAAFSAVLPPDLALAVRAALRQSGRDDLADQIDALTAHHTPQETTAEDPSAIWVLRGPSFGADDPEPCYVGVYDDTPAGKLDFVRPDVAGLYSTQEKDFLDVKLVFESIVDTDVYDPPVCVDDLAWELAPSLSVACSRLACAQQQQAAAKAAGDTSVEQRAGDEAQSAQLHVDLAVRAERALLRQSSLGATAAVR